jgi:hypothetical protein
LKIDRLAQIPSGAARARYSAAGSGSRSEGVAEAGGEFVAPEAEGGGAGAPAVEQLVDGDVLFGGAGLEHDPVELVEVGVVAHGVFELAWGVVDLAAPPGELS